MREELEDRPAGPALVLVGELTCPHCGARQTLPMPTDACLWFHACLGCGALLKPKHGDCCVFCSWGDTACPPVQLAGGFCCDGGAAHTETEP